MLILFCGIRVSEEIVQHPGKAVSGAGYLILDKGLGLEQERAVEFAALLCPVVDDTAVARAVLEPVGGSAFAYGLDLLFRETVEMVGLFGVAPVVGGVEFARVPYAVV